MASKDSLALENRELLAEISVLDRQSKLQQLAESYGLNIKKVTWEDTGRDKNSALGPNISDLTLFAVAKDSRAKDAAATGENMCIVRKPNFTDVTADLSIDKFGVSVGNEVGQKPTRVSLKEYLTNLAKYTGNDKLKSMLLPRDEVLLTRGQFCFLPVEEGDECEFNVCLRNYQSSDAESAVLVVVASAQGTSAQVLAGGTQHLFFDLDGKACNWLLKRLKDDRKAKGKVDLEAKMDAKEEEENALFIYQIPLKMKEEPVRGSYFGYAPQVTSLGGYGGDSSYDKGLAYACATSTSSEVSLQGLTKSKSRSLSRGRGGGGRTKPRAGIDHGIISVGKPHSDFKGVKGKQFERDPKFPIACTVQFYQSTDTCDIPEAMFQLMSEKITAVYKTGVAMGSLVVNEDTGRVTEPDLKKSKTAEFVGSAEAVDKPLFAFPG